MRSTIPFRLLVPAVALLAAACDDSSNPAEPLEDAPIAEAEAPAAAPEQATAALIEQPFWADGYLYARNEAGIVLAQAEASWNRSGGAMTVTKVPGTIGRYVARFRNLTTLLGGKSTVHATAAGIAYGGTYCKPLGAFLVRDSVEVRCYKIGTGAAANTDFSLDVVGKRADRGFAFANQPAAASYTASNAGSYNPGGAIRITRDGVGTYRLVFVGMGAFMLDGSKGHVQVNAVGAGKVHCLVDSWSAAADVSVSVACYAPSGARADSKFTALITGPAAHLAYAWAGDPSAPFYTPNEDYAFNPRGGGIYISRQAVGAYTVRWPEADGEIRNFGHAQVTAWGYNNGQCRLASWNEDAAQVRCYGPSGQAMDTQFTVLLGS